MNPIMLNAVIFLSAAVLLLLPHSNNAQSLQNPCKSANALKSCGQCVKAHPECSWCLDPNFNGQFRCDKKSSISSKCQSNYIYQPKSIMELAQNRELGAVKEDQVTVTQLQPQQVQIKMKPGEKFSFPIKYLHRSDRVSDVSLLNSETSSQGLTVEYAASCKDGVPSAPGVNYCREMANGERATFNATLTLTECKTTGDAVVSIGVGGVRDVVAVYITPLCGCDCERADKEAHRSPLCNGFGSLVCGMCKCLPGYSGNKCQCSGAQESSCKADPSDPEVCSGMGQCDCGKCTCNHDYITGRFCECDGTSCPVADNGIMCAGHGQCNCGKCACEASFTGYACDCTSETRTCRASNGQLCSGKGSCDCGMCKCYEGNWGEFCQEGETTDTTTSAPPTTPGNREPKTNEGGSASGGEAAKMTTTESSAGVASRTHGVAYSLVLPLLATLLLWRWS